MRRLRPFGRPVLSRHFAVADRGIAAVEFALVMPVLVIFMLFGAEVARYVNTTRQLSNLAASTATLISTRTSNVGYLDLVFTFNSAMVTFPQVLKDASAKGIPWAQDIAINLSSIAFTPTVAGCTSNCTYTAKVQWSANMAGQGARSCSTPPLAAPDTNPPSFTTLPTDIFTAGTVIVADVTYNYSPIFGAAFFPAQGIQIRRSVYLQPRYLPQIQNVAVYTANGAPAVGPTYNCP